MDEQSERSPRMGDHLPGGFAWTAEHDAWPDFTKLFEFIGRKHGSMGNPDVLRGDVICWIGPVGFKNKSCCRDIERCGPQIPMAAVRRQFCEILMAMHQFVELG